MRSVQDLNAEYTKDVSSTIDWCNELYQSKFASFFESQRYLYDRLKSKSKPITDEELEEILTYIPLQLFTVSEELSSFRTSYEVIKLKIKEKAAQVEKTCGLSTITARKEEAIAQTIEDNLLAVAYSNIINRVEHEVSFSRELIMGAKKIWDSRRQTDSTLPVGEVNVDHPELPDYKIPNTKPSSYIK